VKKIASHYGADDSQQDIDNDPLTGPIDDLAPDEPRNQTQNHPSQD
jgi:hypothetical protein